MTKVSKKLPSYKRIVREESRAGTGVLLDLTLEEALTLVALLNALDPSGDRGSHEYRLYDMQDELQVALNDMAYGTFKDGKTDHAIPSAKIRNALKQSIGNAENATLSIKVGGSGWNRLETLWLRA